MDQTNQGTPGASNQIAGDMHRQAAIKRIRKQQSQEAVGKAPAGPAVGQPPAPRGY